MRCVITSMEAPSAIAMHCVGLQFLPRTKAGLEAEPGIKNGRRSVRRMASAQQGLVQRELSDEHAVQRNHSAVRYQGAGAAAV